jgi:hypothetical protein
MRMQEPEQWQTPEGQEWQSDQQYGGYRPETGRYEQEQKIYPQEERGPRISVIGIFSIILSAIGFGPAIIGIVGSSIVLKYAQEAHYLLTGGILGLVGSIIALLLFVAIFVLSIVSVARSAVRYRRRGNRGRTG